MSTAPQNSIPQKVGQRSSTHLTLYRSAELPHRLSRHAADDPRVRAGPPTLTLHTDRPHHATKVVEMPAVSFAIPTTIGSCVTWS
jgi:hypothetical protein